MQKRAFLAIILSLGILFSWQFLIQKLYHIENKRVTQDIPYPVRSQQPSTVPFSISGPSTVNMVVPKVEHLKLGVLENDKLTLELVNPGAKINKVFIKDYKLLPYVNEILYTKANEGKEWTFKKYIDRIELRQDENGHFLSQTMALLDNYYLTLEVVYTNNTNSNWTFNDSLALVAIPNNGNPEESRLYEVTFLSANTKRKNPLAHKNRYVHNEAFDSLGFRDRYACVVIKPQFKLPSDGKRLAFDQYTGYIQRYATYTEIGLDLGAISVPANGQLALEYLVYCGPQDIGFLKQAKLGFEDIVYYGSFDFISTGLLSVMNFFHKISRNWGIALILLSIFTFVILYPLTLKQTRSMKDMQKLQPQIKTLQQNHKGNPQKLNKEIMELYRQHKVNPLGGCLPMLLQIPIFFGLYQALSRSIVLKGSQFLWIKDLAEPDKLFRLPYALPVIGQEINLLPILMGIGMFFQQKLTSKTSSPTPEMQQQQKIMVVIFPFMFMFIFYHFPSGLALYWFINTVLSTLSQWKILKTTTQTAA